MMVMMKVLVLVLVLSCVSANSLHENLHFTGCSDTDGEDMYGLDGEVLWYADFISKSGVAPQPSFIDPVKYIEGVYEEAVAGQQVCRQNLQVIRQATKDIPLELDPPYRSIIYSRDALQHGVNNTLICYTTGFYPAPVNISWAKNGEVVTEGTNITVPYPNEDGSFHQLSRLGFSPEQGDIYSCTVEHPALTQPLTVFWDVKMKKRSIGPAVFWGLCLTVGLLGVVAGTFFLVKRVQLIGWHK